jgi:DNA-binding transcriptional regulator YhcF (GntR family)
MNDNSAVTRDLVYQYIVEYKRQHDGLSPSITEMARALSMNRTTARYHVLMLEHEGRIRLVGRRAIQVIGGAWDLPEGDESESGTSDDEDAPDERRAPK